MTAQGRPLYRSASRQPTTPPRPLYARALRLRHLHPGGVLCLLFFEGAMVVGALAALAEFASWWSIPVLPAVVALVVKAEDVATGFRRTPSRPAAAPRHSAYATPPARRLVTTPALAGPERVWGRAAVPNASLVPPPPGPR